MADDTRNALETAARLALAFHDARASRPTCPTASFGELSAAFGGPMPEEGESADAVIARLAAIAEPGLLGTAGPRFFGWVAGGSHPAGVAADWLTSIWGQNAATAHGAPAAAVAEQVAASWLVDVLDLPRECSVGFTTGATMSNFVCLAAARDAVLRRVGWDVEADGLCGAPPISVYVGEGVHASVLAALRYLGIGERRVIEVAADEAGRMQVSALRDALVQQSGPLIVIAQAGHMMTGAFDPIGEIAACAHERGGWVHVDAALGLWVRACPERRHLAAGIEDADSWAADAHKWLQAPYETGCAFVRDANAHRRAMSIRASYLPEADDGVRDPVHYTPELSRRARGFALWALLRTLGRQGIAAMIGRHCALACRIARRLALGPGVALLNEVELNQMIVRFGSAYDDPLADELTLRTIARIQAQGICDVRAALWQGRAVMRLSVISWATTEHDADCAADAILSSWDQVHGDYLCQEREAMALAFG
ncbi:aminotransferase class V-fold PLP-dependent enzyme [Paraburkholderia sp. CNPSo 3157]|uniref:Aminotransferase class V-fold PLP-dependent enzyme n=1 Tax=Paraburkholderia franconis TaxID=2654983 RepID=A0A7X1TG37_9BURK|nr:aminotransferase class V-fold PLP-dependent enzyme [Paraburkholderia franconis]MPW18030.1 aminotransferase class V-fold PLP-dependent enzyme [Paraburkholderia franconis]